MTVLKILGILAGTGTFIFIGYWLWSIGQSSYGFNIYGVGTAIRALISYITFYFGVIFSAESPDDSLVLFLITGILWLWTFLLTAFRTNLLIAIFALIYQMIVSVLYYFIFNAILRTLVKFK
jgi:hypothetical protein